MTCLKKSQTDIMPTSLLHSSVNVFVPVISHIDNLSFTQCQFPAAFKMAQVLPLPKKPSLDNEQITSYWPISNLTIISKITEQLVLTCIAVLRMPAVGILLRAINRDSTTTHLESCVLGHQQQRSYFTPYPLIGSLIVLESPARY